jgi:AraC family transcriptional regulator
MKVVGRGKILVWEGASLWVLRGESAVAHIDLHSHHAIQLTIALDGSFQLRTAEIAVSGPAAIVAADVGHVFSANGIAAMFFIEPESALGRSLATEWLGDRAIAAIDATRIVAVRAALLDAFLTDADNDRFRRVASDFLTGLGISAAPELPDQRVAGMIEYAASHLDEPLSLARVARHVNLSPSRASHLFVEVVGLPLKTYILWLRLQKAVESYSAGATLTDAAHGAGFSDSAHLSRTFRRMFGLPATALQVNQSAA